MSARPCVRVFHAFVSTVIVGILFLSPAFALTPASLDTDIIPAPNSSGTWGYVDGSAKKTIITPRYAHAGFFWEGLAIVGEVHRNDPVSAKNSQTGKLSTIYPVGYGLINRKGEQVLKPDYAKISPATFASPDNPQAHVSKTYVVTKGYARTFLLPEENILRDLNVWKDEPLRGVFHADKGWLLPLGAYETIYFYKEGYFTCDGAYYIDGTKHTAPKGYTLSRPDWHTKTFTFSAENHTIPVEGIMDWTARVIVPAQYHDIKAFPEQRLWAASRVTTMGKAKMAAYFVTGKVSPDTADVVTDIFDHTGKKHHSFASRQYPYMKNNLLYYERHRMEFSYNPRTGKETPIEKETVYNPQNATFRVFKKGSQFGIQDKNGNVTLPPTYAKLHHLSEDRFLAGKSDEYYKDDRGIIDHTGTILLPLEYGGIHTESCDGEKLLVVHKWNVGPDRRNAAGLADMNGKLFTPIQYTNNIYFYQSGQAVVHDGSKRGVIDCAGKTIIPFEYSFISRVKNKAEKTLPYYIVEKDKLYGMFDATGKEIAPLRYGYIHSYNDEAEKMLSSGWLRVENENRSKNGAYNIRTKKEIAVEYDGITIYDGCIAAYSSKDDQAGRTADSYDLYDMAGKKLREYEYLRTDYTNKDTFIVRQKNRYGLVSTQGNILIPCTYEDLHGVEQGFFSAQKDGKDFYVSKKGTAYRIP